MIDTPSFYYRPSGWDTAIYPMPSFPRLATSNVARASTWYQEVLGFAHVFSIPGATDRLLLAHLRWCAYGDLLLTARPNGSDPSVPSGVGVELTFTAPEVHSTVHRAAEHNVHPVRGPIDQPWNTREVTFADLDGFLITFAAPTASATRHILNGTLESMDQLIVRLNRSQSESE